ncbi:MAG: prolyl oligopeptidase family serine peptidase [Tannerellaceae bacterium]|nr:prolyl oligopeptidase family serine peptidase [Tannerellaceae bacterium]
MTRKSILTFLAASLFISLFADEITIREYIYAGPYEVKKPFLIDSVNVNSKKFTEQELLETPLSFCNLETHGQTLQASSSGEILLSAPETDYALNLLSFYVHSDRYTEGELSVKGPEQIEIYVNGRLEKTGNQKISLTLEPKSYQVTIKSLARKNHPDTIRVAMDMKYGAVLTTSTSPKRPYMLDDVTDGKRIQSASISPDGKYISVQFAETFPGGDKHNYSQILDRNTGHVLSELEGDAKGARWMPKSSRLYYTKRGMKGRDLITIDPVTRSEKTLAYNLPEGSFRVSPTEDYLLFTIQEKGPAERKDIQEVLVPDDRQPNWRNRMFIHKYDLSTGMLQRLTYGYHSAFVNDISQDGRYLLFSSSEPFLTERPFRRLSLYQMDLQTLQTDTILAQAKFVNRALFSPDGKQLLISGSGDAFDGIGLRINEGQTSNTSDGQLFLYNLADRQVIPLTTEFNPSVDRAVWNKQDNRIYIAAKDRDYVRLYSLQPEKGTIHSIPVQEEIVSGFDLATTAPEMVYYGLSISNSERLYGLNLKKETSTCLADLSKEILTDVQLGDTRDWNFVSEAGDTIYGRYYLPPHFDPAKKYPLIVNYYGGTTPTARVLESRYPSHVYAGMGFVVYIVQPSGATGFGQEFSARHVNAWGKQTAEEIIEGTLQFCEAHSFINKEKIGCMGASYGGFMTMYLQTKTDIFAAAMSHAGISDIISYWGEGYWGYSYSALASADSYPWNARDMYTLQSPLFSADKINTPILFLHGEADTNVPVGESIQMFTALKLLGKPTAFVKVKGEDHHILDYDKRIRWNNTIYAWFYKWLKDQPEWWDALYPPKTL